MAGWGKNENEELGKKNKKGERKREENYMKKGEKGLKNASFWVINSKNFRKLVHRGKKMISKGGGGGMIELDNIYPWKHYLCKPRYFKIRGILYGHTVCLIIYLKGAKTFCSHKHM